ncbi:MAG: hypothetical protein ACHQVS_00615 [Candidatus Babeliales bacterium]
MKQPLYRHSAPTKYDQAPYGTLCEVINSEGNQLYVQRSRDEENPLWVHMGDVSDELVWEEE